MTSLSLFSVHSACVASYSCGEYACNRDECDSISFQGSVACCVCLSACRIRGQGGHVILHLTLDATAVDVRQVFIDGSE